MDLVIEVAKKGAVATAVLALSMSLVVGVLGYTILLALNGYAWNGTYGGLVAPTLLAGLLSLWSVRRLFAGILTGAPLIFFDENQLHYVARGHATVSLPEVGSFSIEGQGLRRLYFFDAVNGAELRHYPLFLSSSTNEEIIRNLTAIGLKGESRTA